MRGSRYNEQIRIDFDDGAVYLDRLLQIFKNGRHNLPNLVRLIFIEIQSLTSSTISSAIVDRKLIDAPSRSGVPRLFHYKIVLAGYDQSMAHKPRMYSMINVIDDL